MPTERENVAVISAVDNRKKISFVDREDAMKPENDCNRMIGGLLIMSQNPDGEECVVLQRRQVDKKEFPDCLTFTASGHVNPVDSRRNSGKPIWQAAIAREAAEEVGFVPGEFDHILSFQSIEDKGENKVKKNIFVALATVDSSQLSQLTFDEKEVKSLEMYPISTIASQLQLEPTKRDPAFKFSTPFEQFFRKYFLDQS